jgi:hypothetical protein
MKNSIILNRINIASSNGLFYYNTILINNPAITFDIIKILLQQQDDSCKAKRIIKNYSCNPTLKLDDVFQNSNLNWDYSKICARDDFTIEHIKKIPSKKIYKIIHNKNIPIEEFFKILKKSLNMKKRDFVVLKKRKDLTLTQILSNPIAKFRLHSQYEWDWTYISRYSKITINDLKNKKIENLPLNWLALVNNPNISFDDIINNPKLPWNMTYIHLNYNITLKNVVDNPTMEWCGYELTKKFKPNMKVLLEYPMIKWNYSLCSEYLPLTDIFNNMTIKWDFNEICRRNDITIDLIRQNINCRWNFTFLAKSSCFTLAEILDNLDFEWKFTFIQYNPNLTENNLYDLYEGYLCVNNSFEYSINKDALYAGASNNLNLSLDFIKNNIANIDFCWRDIAQRSDLTFDLVKSEIYRFDDFDSDSNSDYNSEDDDSDDTKQLLFKNPSIFKIRPTDSDYIEYVNNKKRENSQKIISKAWRKCISDPNYKICKKRLQEEFNELI